MAQRGMRVIGKLDPNKIAALPPGKHEDGGGLRLVVRKSGSRSWELRYLRNRKAETIGLGPWPDVSISEARYEAEECRRLLRNKKDPREARNEKLRDKLRVEVKGKIFREDGEDYIKDNEDGWVPNIKRQRERILETHVYNIILEDGRRFGEVPSRQIDVAAVLAILQRRTANELGDGAELGPTFWRKKNPTAKRARWLIEKILDRSMVVNKWKGENPARWRDNLDKVLPKPSTVHKTKHHPSLRFAKAPAYLANLRGSGAKAAGALEFVIHNPVRIEAAVGATWDEFNPVETLDGVKFPDLKWSIREERMKGYKEIEFADGKYESPLTEPSVQILEQQWKVRESKYVFSGRKFGQHITQAAVLKLAKSLTTDEITTHGFRSTFETWSDERTICEDWVKEMCLGHAVGNETEKAYRRSELFEKRRLLMEAWSEYLITGRDVAVNINERFMERFIAGFSKVPTAPRTSALTEAMTDSGGENSRLSRIAIIDLEASSLTKTSYPTEIGWALFRPNGSVESGSCLIRPAAKWLLHRNAWSTSSEHLTGITREMLDRNGLPPNEALTRFLEAVRDHDLYSDAPIVEERWLSMLADAAGVSLGERKVGDLEGLIDEMGLTTAFSEPPRHRAEADARRLLMGLRDQRNGLGRAALADAAE